MVTSLADRMPDNSIQGLYPRVDVWPWPEFHDAIAEMVGCIHAGNPSIKIVMHVRLPAGEGDRFLAFRDSDLN